jgi:pimeloyl-ACP methyl ester carboxylesterase
VLTELDLQNVTLVGFSMGGGEVARYMSKYNGARVKNIIFVSAVTPYLLKTADNPDGVDKSTFDEMIENLGKDRFDFLATFGKKFYGQGVMSKPVTQATLDWSQALAIPASPHATTECVRAFSGTDFRADLATIKVPTLFIHGSDDQTVPLANSAEQAVKHVANARLIVYDGEAHGLNVTAKDRLNRDILTFVSGQPVQEDYDSAEVEAQPIRTENE